MEKKNTFEIEYTENVSEPKQSKKWFLERVGKAIYSFQVKMPYYIGGKKEAIQLFENQNNGRRYKDIN
jgi:hypothetical protein